jgi:hypothetical protein
MFNAKTFSIGALLTATGLLGGCSTLQVTSDVNPKQSVTACHTYAWAAESTPPGPGRAEANPVNAERLRSAIDASLRMKGLQPGEPAAADCLVGYAVGAHQYLDIAPYAPGWGWGMGWGWGWRRGFASLEWEQPYVYHEGFITVDLYNAKTHTPIWHASVNQDIARLTGSKADEKINAAVAALFAKYPG